jgi:hypothetical protein
MTALMNLTSVTILDGGTGYTNVSPIAKAYKPDTTDGGATFTITTNGGSILSIDVVDGGTGYQPIVATAAFNTITGYGAQVFLEVNQVNGVIRNAYIVNAGTGYVSTDTISVVHPKGTAANLKPTFNAAGELVSIQIVHGGFAYKDIVPTLKIVSSSDTTKPHPYGVGLSADLLIDSSTGAILAVGVSDGGTAYIDAPPVAVITDTTGSGALIDLVQTAGVITSATIKNGGYGYSQTPTMVAENPPTSPKPTKYATFALTVQQNRYGVDSAYYWQVASGAVTDKVVQDQIDQVISYFTKLGYTITATVNPDNGYTLMWTICW